MEIIVGKTAGFCGGVTNAVKQTENLLKEGKEIFCLGELVHNAQVMEKLEKQGLNVIENIEEAKPYDCVVIRAHGVPPIIYQKAKENQIQLKDLTCPKVLKIHEKAEEYKQKGYYLFLMGAKKHPEVVGIFGFCGEDACIIENKEDIPISIQNFKNSKRKKIAIISQTTFSLKKFEEYTEEIKQSLNNTTILVDNTICNATSTRQKETGELAKNVDAMIIIGGKNSSNTKKLYELAKEECPIVQMIETEEDLELDTLQKQKRIGIMAGASTPRESIENVIKKLEAITVW